MKFWKFWYVKEKLHCSILNWYPQPPRQLREMGVMSIGVGQGPWGPSLWRPYLSCISSLLCRDHVWNFVNHHETVYLIEIISCIASDIGETGLEVPRYFLGSFITTMIHIMRFKSGRCLLREANDDYCPFNWLKVSLTALIYFQQLKQNFYSSIACFPPIDYFLPNFGCFYIIQYFIHYKSVGNNAYFQTVLKLLSNILDIFFLKFLQNCYGGAYASMCLYAIIMCELWAVSCSLRTFIDVVTLVSIFL